MNNNMNEEHVSVTPALPTLKLACFGYTGVADHICHYIFRQLKNDF